MKNVATIQMMALFRVNGPTLGLCSQEFSLTLMIARQCSTSLAVVEQNKTQVGCCGLQQQSRCLSILVSAVIILKPTSKSTGQIQIVSGANNAGKYTLINPWIFRFKIYSRVLLSRHSTSSSRSLSQSLTDILLGNRGIYKII